MLSSTATRDWWTVLHPPYTIWHLSYVVIGACIEGPVNFARLIATTVAFFLAVGIGAHTLDELHGRPLGTSIPRWQLILASVFGLGSAVALGIIGVFVVSVYLALFIGIGVAIAIGYNLELFHGRLHTNAMFALGWGSFPLLTSYFAQHATISVASVIAAVFAALMSRVQRQLSSPARDLRRRTTSVQGLVVRSDGTEFSITKDSLLSPLEQALRTLCWAVVILAATLLVARLHLT